MSLKTELESMCRHPDGYFYVQDATGKYRTPIVFLCSLSPDILNARYGFRSTGGQKEYWIYRTDYGASTEEFVFRTYVPEGRQGWATDFESTKSSQTHYYEARTKDGQMVSLCGKQKRKDDESALFILQPQSGTTCKACAKELAQRKG